MLLEDRRGVLLPVGHELVEFGSDDTAALVERRREYRLEALDAGLTRILADRSLDLQRPTSDQLSAGDVRDVQLVVADEVPEGLGDVAELDRNGRLRVYAATYA